MNDQSLLEAVLQMLGSGLLGALAWHAGASFFRARRARRYRAVLAAALDDLETKRGGISERRLLGTIRLLTEPLVAPSTEGSRAQGSSSSANAGDVARPAAQKENNHE